MFLFLDLLVLGVGVGVFSRDYSSSLSSLSDEFLRNLLKLIIKIYTSGYIPFALFSLNTFAGGNSPF